MEAMAKGLLENPDALGEQIQQLEEGLTGGGEGGAGGLLEGLTGSGGDGESGSDSATEQLKSLFE
jgi:hypothetical protein